MVDVRDIEQAERPPPARPRLLTLVAAALIVIAGLAVILDQDTSRFVDPASPEAVAESFMEAWVRGDGEALAAKFSPDEPSGGFDAEMLPALHDWYRAVGQEYHSEGCELWTERRVSCAYTFENKLTRALGWEQVTGSFHLFLDVGLIRNFSDDLGFDADHDAYRDLWEMFAAWVLANHPDEFSRVYASFDPLLHTSLVLEPASISLWEQYTDEFVASPGATAQYFVKWQTRAEQIAWPIMEVDQGADPGGMPGPKPEYIEQAIGICAAASARFEIAAEEFVWTDAEEWTLQKEAAWSETAARISEEALVELRALSPPEADQGRFHEILSLMQQQTDVLRQIAEAATAGDAELVQTLSHERVDLTHRKDAIAGPDLGYCPVGLPA